MQHVVFSKESILLGSNLCDKIFSIFQGGGCHSRCKTRATMVWTNVLIFFPHSKDGEGNVFARPGTALGGNTANTEPIHRCLLEVANTLTCSTGREKWVWASISISAARTVSLSTVGRCRRLWTTPRNRGRSLRIVSVMRVTTCRHISASCNTVQKTLPQEITLTNGQFQSNGTILRKVTIRFRLYLPYTSYLPWWWRLLQHGFKFSSMDYGEFKGLASAIAQQVDRGYQMRSPQIFHVSSYHTIESLPPHKVVTENQWFNYTHETNLKTTHNIFPILLKIQGVNFTHSPTTIPVYKTAARDILWCLNNDHATYRNRWQSQNWTGLGCPMKLCSWAKQCLYVFADR